VPPPGQAFKRREAGCGGGRCVMRVANAAKACCAYRELGDKAALDRWHERRRMAHAESVVRAPRLRVDAKAGVKKAGKL
jgi:hypothetical protein